MYKVFVNKKELILTTKLPKKTRARVLPLRTTPLKEIIRILRTTKVQKLYLIHDDSNKLISQFKEKLPVIIAAGGVVKNQEGKLLFIFRKNKWDLPKGKIDKGETLEEGAKREVKEETGVKKLKVGPLVGITYHIFKRNNRYKLKESHWFYMTTVFTGELIPQTKEDITKAVWKGKKKVVKALEKTYPNIDHLLNNIDLLKSLSEEE